MFYIILIYSYKIKSFVRGLDIFLSGDARTILELSHFPQSYTQFDVGLYLRDR